MFILSNILSLLPNFSLSKHDRHEAFTLHKLFSVTIGVGIPTGMDNMGVFCQTWCNSDKFSTLNLKNRPSGSNVRG